MSYNIDTWTTKKLVDLKINLYDVLSMPNVKMEIEDREKQKVKFYGLNEGFELTGTLNGNTINVDSIHSSGEFSGRSHDMLLEVLKESTGFLSAILVWERGDSIQRLVADNGNVTETDLEIE